jgi:hypothetical protein
MSKDDCESVSYFLLLIRNIVHAPEGVRANQSASVGDSATYFAAAASPGHWQQRRLLSDLLTQGLDLLLIDLLTCSQKVLVEIDFIFIIVLNYSISQAVLTL